MNLKTTSGHFVSTNQMLFLVRLTVSSLLIFYLYSKIDKSGFLSHLQTLAHCNLIFAGAFLFALLIINAQRWKLVLADMNHQESFFVLWRICMIGAFFNQALPSSIGGDAVRAWELSKKGMPLTSSSISVIVDRFSGFMVMIIFSALAIPLLSDNIEQFQMLTGLSLIVFSAFIAFMIIMYLDRFLDTIEKSIAYWRDFHLSNLLLRLVDGLTNLPINLRNILFRSRRSGFIFLLSVNIQFGHVLVAWFLCISMDANVSLWDCFIVVTPAILLSAIPVSVAGWGVREGVMVAALQLLGTNSDLALAVSILFGLTILMGSLPGGIFWLFSRKQTMQSELK